MKKALILVLSLVLCLALAAPALAENVGVSQQTLKVDGEIYKCDKYNIDGSNYFKLRDLGYLLTDTGSQFSVGFDAASNTVAITTGKAYTYTGKEMLLGADASRTAQKSAQTILIDGKENSAINAYNIGGSNYFKLRDLGDALGFDVDFDAASNTAIVMSRPGKYLLSRETSSGTYTDYDVAEDGTETTVTGTYSSSTNYTYDARGRMTGSVSEEKRDGQTLDKTTARFTYNANGTPASATYTHSDGASESLVYDEKGNLLRQTVVYGDDTPSDTTTYTYNSKGYQTSSIYQAGDYAYTTQYTYDASNNLIAEKSTSNEGPGWDTVYTYDAAGNCLTETYSSYGNYTSKTVRTFNAAGRRLSEKSSTDFGDHDSTASAMTYTYDAAGNLVKEVYSLTTVWDGQTNSSSYTCVYTHDANGNKLTDTTTYSDGSTVKLSFTYDANGNCLTETCVRTGNDGFSWKTSHSYDEQGNLINTVQQDEDGSVSYTYTYDANGNMTKWQSSEGAVMTWEYIPNNA